MKMNRILPYIFIAALIFTLSCKQKQSAQQIVTPPSVDVIYPIIGNIQETGQINGQVIYLNKNTVAAPITGYVTSIKKAVGDHVNKGDLLYVLQTKESAALQNSGFSKSGSIGLVSVSAGTSGYISTLSVTSVGDFVSEGLAMASIVQTSDLLIQINTPYENTRKIIHNHQVEIELSDKNRLTAIYYKSIPLVDAVSQTQQLFFKLKDFQILPENLNVMVYFLKAEKHNCLTLPKDAVLTNETQDEFWVMKLTKDSLAVKIPIEKGLEANGKIEILKPALTLTDKIIQSGAYGLPDSTKVTIK